MRTIRTARFIRAAQSHAQSDSDSGDNGGTPTTPDTAALAPFIKEVCGGSVATNSTTRLIIRGFYFTPTAIVSLYQTNSSIPSSLIGILQGFRFIDPSHIEVTLQTQQLQGTFSILVTNGALDSGTSGDFLLRIINPRWRDLRLMSLSTMGIEKTAGVSIFQKRANGLWIADQNTAWNRAVKFNAFQWKRCDQIDFNLVLYNAKNQGEGLFGIGAASIDVNQLGESPQFIGEIQFYYQDGKIQQLFGGGSPYRQWTQQIEAVTLKADSYYKIHFQHAGAIGATIRLSRVSVRDFNQDLEVVQEWISNAPSDSPVLVPYWTAISNPNLFLTAFKLQ